MQKTPRPELQRMETFAPAYFDYMFFSNHGQRMLQIICLVVHLFIRFLLASVLTF